MSVATELSVGFNAGRRDEDTQETDPEAQRGRRSYTSTPAHRREQAEFTERSWNVQVARRARGQGQIYRADAPRGCLCSTSLTSSICIDLHCRPYAITMTTSTEQVPLFHGVALYSNPNERALLVKHLARLLAIERPVRLRAYSQSDVDDTKLAAGSPKESWSHAHAIFSNIKTTQRADSTGVATALWRLRLWTGQGWVDNVTSS